MFDRKINIFFKVGLIVIRRKWLFFLKKARKYFSQKRIIGNSTEFLKFIFEILVILPHPTPFTQDIRIDFQTTTKLKSYYKLNEIFNLLLLLRVFIILRFFVIRSFYYGNRAQRTCQFYAVAPNYWFSFKCMLKSRPYLVMSSSLLVIILIFGQAMRICERSYYLFYYIYNIYILYLLLIFLFYLINIQSSIQTLGWCN